MTKDRRIQLLSISQRRRSPSQKTISVAKTNCHTSSGNGSLWPIGSGSPPSGIYGHGNQSLKKKDTHLPHECHVCKKWFAKLRNLKRHQQVHTGEKPFQCDVCKKRLSLLPSLKEHQRTHTSERPFEWLHDPLVEANRPHLEARHMYHNDLLQIASSVFQIFHGKPSIWVGSYFDFDDRET